jgi:hypothetical protein
VWNDGFVPVPSTHWTVADLAISKDLSFDLPNTANFSSFVKPHLASGPRGDHEPDVPGEQGYRSDAQGDFIYAADRPQLASVTASAETLKPDFAKAVTLAPKQVVEVSIPVPSATNFGTTFMAAREISATLYDDKGTTVGRNLAGTPEADAKGGLMALR